MLFIIANYIVKIKFVNRRNHFSRNNLKDKIKNTFSDFAVKKSSKKVDIEIDIYNRALSIKKYSSSYASLLYIHDLNRIIAFQHISIDQFTHILSTEIHHRLVKESGFRLHSSASLIRGKAQLFIGPSRAGKSTIMTLLNPEFPALADDSIIIRKIKNQLFCYQSPLIEKNSWVKKTKNKYSLGNFYFLRKSKTCSINPINDQNKIVKKLSRQVWWVKDGNMKKQITSLTEFASLKDRFFTLSFNKNKTEVTNLFR